MTHQVHPSVTRQVVQVLSEHGFEGMAQAMECLLNECMKIERQQALGVGPYQRGEARRAPWALPGSDGFTKRSLLVLALSKLLTAVSISNCRPGYPIGRTYEPVLAAVANGVQK